MECLIDYKTDDSTPLNSKCRSAVEHFQLISMKDFRFNAHFKKACKADINHLCPTNLKQKHKVVACLSEIVRDDSLQSNTHRVSQPCRQQLRRYRTLYLNIFLSSIVINNRLPPPSQLAHQHEDVRLNPVVNEPCKMDEEKFCHDVKPGQGRVSHILRYSLELSPCYGYNRFWSV